MLKMFARALCTLTVVAAVTAIVGCGDKSSGIKPKGGEQLDLKPLPPPGSPGGDGGKGGKKGPGGGPSSI
jgi:hypothetical protein